MRFSKRMLVALATVGAISAVLAGNAFAYGQCGAAVSNGTQLYQSWVRMGVTSQAARVVVSAGFHRMDGSLSSFMRQRVVRAPLARSANPIDYGCNPGRLFSVGHRKMAKGTAIMVALPLKYSKADISTSARKGWKRAMFRVASVGKSDCSNPLQGKVWVYLWVRSQKKPTPKPKNKKVTPPPVVIPVVVPPPVVTQTAAQACAVKAGIWDSSVQLCTIVQIVGSCSNITVVTGSGNVVSVTQEGNCNTTPPTPPTIPPPVTPPVIPPPVTPPPLHWTQVTCTGFEEISGGTSMLIKCDVTDDNGAPIALSVGVSDSNVVKVSGINCYSQGGNPSCSGNGQFEFRVNATNDGSMVLQESVTVTATANGVPQTPSPYYFLVDPSVGGF